MKKTFNLATYLYFTGIVLSLISACGTNSKEVTPEPHKAAKDLITLTTPQYQQAEIKTDTITQRTMGLELQVNGVIDVPPKSNVSIHIPYGGFIKRIEVLPGTRIQKGQLLGVVENPEFIQFQQDYLESLASREFLKAEYKRQEELYQEKVASGKNYQQAKSNYLANEARLKSQEERLKLIGFSLSKLKTGSISASVNLYAPVSGSVREVYANVGKYNNPQEAVMDLTNTEDLHVELTVYENDIPRIKEGQRIRFSLVNSPDQWREANVFLTGSGVREDRSVTVHGHLKEAYEDLKPGMYVSARIETDSHKVWAVPENAIVRFTGKYYIFTAKGERLENGETVHVFKMVEVTKGYTEEGYTQISLVDDSLDISRLKLVKQGAFTLLAKAKNTEEEGHGH